MPELSLLQRNPRLILKQYGVEDESEKAARILALCADKPIRVIRKTEDLPGFVAPKKTRAQVRAGERRQKLLSELESGPKTIGELSKVLGMSNDNGSLVREVLDGTGAKSSLVMVQTAKGLRRTTVWTLTD